MLRELKQTCSFRGSKSRNKVEYKSAVSDSFFSKVHFAEALAACLIHFKQVPRATYKKINTGD